jgi:hypothetical protein
MIGPAISIAGRLAPLVARHLAPAVASTLTGTAFNAGLGLLSGQGPKEMAPYLAADVAFSLPATLGARVLGSKIKKPVMGIKPQHLAGGLETTANMGASLASMSVVNNMLYGGQDNQVAQQNTQRAVQNNENATQLFTDLLERSPGTMYQLTPRDIQTISENRRRRMDEYVDAATSGNDLNMASIANQMGGIVGV